MLSCVVYVCHGRAVLARQGKAEVKRILNHYYVRPGRAFLARHLPRLAAAVTDKLAGGAGELWLGVAPAQGVSRGWLVPATPRSNGIALNS